MKTKTALSILLLLTASTSTTYADLIIRFEDVSTRQFIAGQASSIDVFVSSDATDSFQNYSLDFLVEGTADFFIESAIPAPQLTATSPDYIFLGNSLEEDQQLGIDFADSVGPDSFLTVADETFDLTDREISSTDGEFLLARLNFIAPTAGDFTIELDTLTSGFFDNGNAESAVIDEVASILTTNFTASAAVPEPSGFACLAIFGACCVARRKYRAFVEKR